jgi:predicted amidophosphoribosyltransferase
LLANARGRYLDSLPRAQYLFIPKKEIKMAYECFEPMQLCDNCKRAKATIGDRCEQCYELLQNVRKFCQAVGSEYAKDLETIYTAP